MQLWTWMHIARTQHTECKCSNSLAVCLSLFLFVFPSPLFHGKEKKSAHCFWRIHSIEHMCSMIFFSIQFGRYACTCIICTLPTHWHTHTHVFRGCHRRTCQMHSFNEFMWTQPLCEWIIISTIRMCMYERFRALYVLLFSANFFHLSFSVTLGSVQIRLHSLFFFVALPPSCACRPFHCDTTHHQPNTMSKAYVLVESCMRAWLVFAGWAKIRLELFFVVCLLLLFLPYLIFQRIYMYIWAVCIKANRNAVTGMTIQNAITY